MSTELILPPGYHREAADGRLRGGVGPSGEVSAIIDNRTDLPDQAVYEAITDQFVGGAEFAGLQFGSPTNFQLYATSPQGSMLARTPFQTPRTVIEEVKLARSVVDTDDDIAGLVGLMIATAFGDGFQNHHEDEDTLEWFNEICKPANAHLERVLKEMYREYLIAGSVSTITLPQRSRLSFYPQDGGDEKTAQLSVPIVGVLPAENLRVTTNDVIGQGELAYKVEDNHLKEWLDEYFAPRTSAARKDAMRRTEPVAAAVFTGKIHVDWNDSDMLSAGQDLYTLNPRMVHRTTMPKGASPYARPPLTANFALLEAKRLLNIMDYALLQGGTNYIVVAKKGTDNLPANQPEIDNLVDQVRTASRAGVMVGDHRLSIEIVTPKLDELLNPAKRNLIARKLTMRLLRLPEQVTHDPGSSGSTQELEFTSRVISSDRRDIKNHVESTVYEETANRNRATFKKGAPSLWFPRIILAGSKDFFTAVLQARDRGDIPRRWAVETLGFDWAAGVAERKREIARGEDDVMQPASVPFSPQPGGEGAPGEADPFGRPGGGPPDTQRGRPPGSSSNNGRGGDSAPAPSFRPRQMIQRTRGETIRAFIEDGELIRVGELTQAVLDEYPDYQVGRITAAERGAVESSEPFIVGPVAIIPVNQDYTTSEIRALRLADGLSLVIGARDQDGALVTRALCFREPEYTMEDAEERALRWGFADAMEYDDEARKREQTKSCKNCGNELPSYSTMCPNCGANPDTGAPAGGGGMTGAEQVAKIIAEVMKNLPQQNITVQLPGEQAKRIIRDEQGNIIGTEPLDAEDAIEEWIAAEEFAGKYSQAERRQGAKEGWALPDGSFPIKNAQDVQDAVGLVGNYKGKYDAKAHVKKRAAAVGASDKIPDSWS